MWNEGGFVQPNLEGIPPPLDKYVLSNYQPVSNLTYVSKVIEWVVAKQLVDYAESNHLSGKFQSAYRQYHSTETSLTSFANDILMALDQKQAIFLVLLDLSANFDTVNHRVLPKPLETKVSLRDNALDWVRSYLSQCQQHVSIGGGKSSSQKLKLGVPQLSVLGLILFSIYILPLGDIVRKYDMSFNLNADDTQLYLLFDSSV